MTPRSSSSNKQKQEAKRTDSLSNGVVLPGPGNRPLTGKPGSSPGSITDEVRQHLESARRWIGATLHSMLGELNTHFVKLGRQYDDLVNQGDLAGLKKLNAERKRLNEDIEKKWRDVLTYLTGDRIDRKAIDLNEVAVSLGKTPPSVAWTAEIPNPCPLYADLVLLEYVLLELIANSLKYCKPSVEPSLHLTARAYVKEDVEWVEITYTDNGLGIEHDLKEEVFEFGFRSVRGTESGSGLGLSFVKRVVEKHGGNIRECGTPGNGARFVIELPRFVLAAKGAK